MNFLASFDDFMTGNGIWIVVGILALSLVVTVVFLVLNILKARKESALKEGEEGKQAASEDAPEEEKSPEEQEEIKKSPEEQEEIKEEKEAGEEKKEEDKAGEKPKKTASKVKKSNSVKEDKTQKEHVEKQVKEEKPMTKETYGVTYDKENRQWVVKKTGSARASKRCATKAEALEYAEKLSEAKGANLRVHKKDGKFQKR